MKIKSILIAYQSLNTDEILQNRSVGLPFPMSTQGLLHLLGLKRIPHELGMEQFRTTRPWTFK